jgi:hypothetical protein
MRGNADKSEEEGFLRAIPVSPEDTTLRLVYIVESNMNVRVRIQFDSPESDDWAAMRSIARSLTNRPDSIRVFADDENSRWLVAEFAMPTEAQYAAVPKIDSAIRLRAWRRQDSTIFFPMSEAERERAERKAERRRARRRNTQAEA